MAVSSSRKAGLSIFSSIRSTSERAPSSAKSSGDRTGRRGPYSRNELVRSVEAVLGILIIIGADAVVYDVLAGSRGFDLGYYHADRLRYARSAHVTPLATPTAFA